MLNNTSQIIYRKRAKKSGDGITRFQNDLSSRNEELRQKNFKKC